VILQYVREVIQKLSSAYGNYIKFDYLTGLRASEVVESVHLIKNRETFHQYYKPERMALEHFRFLDIFFGQTKKAYISFADKETLETAKAAGNDISYNAIRLTVQKKRKKKNRIEGINRLDMAFYRKIFASHLKQSGIEAEIVDLLQGRVLKTVFARHYFTPKLDYREKVITALQSGIPP
jgi:intergrase/recombinase